MSKVLVKLATKKFLVAFPSEMLKKVDALAKHEYRTRSSLIREALHLYIAESPHEVLHSTLSERVEYLVQREARASRSNLIREAVRRYMAKASSCLINTDREMKYEEPSEQSLEEPGWIPQVV